MTDPHAQAVKQTVERLQKGQLPDDQEISAGLDKMRHTDPFTSVNLSTTGQRVVHDFQEVATSARPYFAEKHMADHVQAMIDHSRKAAQLIDKEKLKAPDSASNVNESFKTTFDNMTDLTRLLLTSADFRSAVSDLVAILTDVVRYNIGDATVEDSPLSTSESRPDIVRSTAHRMVDVIADSVPERQEAQSALQETTREVEQGRKRTRDVIKDMGSDALRTVKDRTNKVEFPPEKRDELLNRLKTTLRTFQQNEEYQRALENVFDSVDNLVQAVFGYARDVRDKGKEAATSNEADRHVKEAWGHAKSLAEGVAGDRSLDPVIAAFETFANDVRNDSRLAAYVSDWKLYIHRTVAQPGFIDGEDFFNIGRNLVDKGRQYFDELYSQHLRTVFDEIQAFLHAIRDDAVNQDFVSNIKKLVADLFLDDNGNVTIKSELIGDFQKVLPILADKIAYIPIPRIEFEDDDNYFMIDNLVLKCNGLLPKHVHAMLSATLDADLGRLQGQVRVSAAKIQVSAVDAAFSFRRKSGLIKFRDSGLVNFDILDDGLAVDVLLEPWVSQEGKGLHLLQCRAYIDTLHIRFHETTKHHALYKIFKGPIEKIAKKQLQRVMTENIRKVFE